MTILYSTAARAVGGRQGRVESDDGILQLDLAMPQELGGRGGATNPEQLFAAGYAACFENAVRHIARAQKITLAGTAVTGQVSLLPAETGFRLAVALKVEIEGLDQAEAETLVAAAHQVCPYSNAVRGNIDIALSVSVT